jgi:hypothetical protein
MPVVLGQLGQILEPEVLIVGGEVAGNNAAIGAAEKEARIVDMLLGVLSFPGNLEPASRRGKLAGWGCNLYLRLPGKIACHRPRIRWRRLLFPCPFQRS